MAVKTETIAHTPGPWHWDGDLLGPDDQEILAIGPGYDGLWGGEHPSEPDGRLIEAAPDLLQAAKDTLDYWDSIGFSECDEGCDCIVQIVQAAIAKAEGR